MPVTAGYEFSQCGMMHVVESFACVGAYDNSTRDNTFHETKLVGACMLKVLRMRSGVICCSKFALSPRAVSSIRGDVLSYPATVVGHPHHCLKLQSVYKEEADDVGVDGVCGESLFSTLANMPAMR